MEKEGEKSSDPWQVIVVQSDRGLLQILASSIVENLQCITQRSGSRFNVARFVRIIQVQLCFIDWTGSKVDFEQMGAPFS